MENNALEEKPAKATNESTLAVTLDDHLKVVSGFEDYTRFQDPDAEQRKEAKQRFIDNQDYVPAYMYPKLRLFQDEDKIVSKKTDVYNAVLEIESSRTAANLIGDESRASELLLYRKYHDLRLQKIMLVEAAAELHNSGTSSAQETAKENFSLMNQEVYGQIDGDLYKSMLGAERKRVNDFVPTNSAAGIVAQELGEVLEKIGEPAQEERELLLPSEIEKLQQVVLNRYQPVLAVVPNTNEDVYYDANQCAEIMTQALHAGGLGEKGWYAEVDSAKSNPSTNTALKKIALPAATRRTASELRRLIVHEQEVHARRGQNGLDKQSKLLSSGTADYVDVEEGLGVLLECAVEGNLSNPSFNRARERYITAGLALGIDSAPRDAREVYEIVWRMIALDSSTDGSLSEKSIDTAKNKAYLHIENAFRSTGFYQKGVIYTKLKVYYEGLAKNAEFIRSNIDNLDAALDAAMQGKFNHTDPNEVALIQKITANNTTTE